jgi:hypothetical protein
MFCTGCEWILGDHKDDLGEEGDGDEFHTPLVTEQPSFPDSPTFRPQAPLPSDATDDYRHDLLVQALARKNQIRQIARLPKIAKRSFNGNGGEDWAAALHHRNETDPENEVNYKALARQLRCNLRPRIHCIRLRSFDRSLSGQEIIQWLLRSNEAANREDALHLGQRLVENKVLTVANTGDTEFGNTAEFRFDDAPACLYQFDNDSDPTKTAVPCLPEDLSVGVVDWEEGYEQEKRQPSFVQYILEVAAMGQKWVLHKRYREFAILHKKLQKLCPLGGLPTLPKKHAKALSHSLIDGVISASSKWDEEFLESRRESLDCYMRAVTFIAVAQPDILGPVVVCFLDPQISDPSNSNGAADELGLTFEN